MGTGIAQVAALAGHPVLLLDAAPERARAGVAAVRRSLDRLVERGRLGVADARAAHGRVRAVDSLAAVGDSALVVEAVAESLDAKRTLFAALEDVVAPDTVLATNTSSLSVTDIAAGLHRPGRCAGLHFFNPAPVMRLVEVVAGDRTDPAVTAEIADLVTAWGKTPVHVRTSPGFIVNRVARPFYGEAMRLLEHGVDPATVDAVLRECGGFPLGPLELTDLIGQDVNLATTRSVWEQTGRDPRFEPAPVQVELVASGHLGRKTGRGFYEGSGSSEGAGPSARASTARRGPTRPAAAEAPSSVAPSRVRVRGDWGPWAPLWDRVRTAGVVVEEGPTSGAPVAELDGGLLVPTRGRTATDCAESDGDPVVVLDLAGDAATTRRWAVAACDGCPPAALDRAVGLLQATGAAVTVLPDVPGLLVARTVALLVDEACDVVGRGVASASDVDTAMRLGAGYPRGPLEWGERIGPHRVAALLDALAPTNARYRVSPTLRAAVRDGRSLREL
ncbi:MAG: 3-hydroxyacyl-CoA dehydrogenase [Actinotalea sp.]|nr:3-hydroxyacyl-CoA dehydrogenase [Actinotalea sp.]